MRLPCLQPVPNFARQGLIGRCNFIKDGKMALEKIANTV
jgi:hypothetical protein